MHRYIVALIWCLSGVVVLAAQSADNPFELLPRLPQEERTGAIDPVRDSLAALSRNPFEIVQPIPEAPPEPVLEVIRDPVISPEPPEKDDGFLFGLNIFLVLLTALILVFFRGLYRRGFRALFNDNLLGQLYRDREANALGPFLVGYFLFFLSAAFFVYLLLTYYGLSAPERPLLLYFFLIGALTLLFLGKHLLLWLVGAIFPVSREMSRYSFTIMVFAIIIGLLLTPASLFISYVPETVREPLILLTLGMVAALYLLRSLRGLFIANRFVLGNLFHFLLYICTVEVAPVLVLYKIVLNNMS